MNAAIISWIRSVVPVAVGAAISWLLTLGIELDADTQAGLIVALTGVLITGYYSLARLLEKKWPVFGVLLGVAKTPDSYSKGDEPKPVSTTPSIVTLYPPRAPEYSETPIYDSVSKDNS